MACSRQRAVAAVGIVLAAIGLPAAGQEPPATAAAGAQADTAAREPAGGQTDTVAGLRVGGPAVPVAPAVIARDAAGRVTVRAVRIATPLDIDGRLDEAVYASVPAMSDFIQTDPDEGAPATEKTEIWLLFDDDNVYVVGRCWETQPERLMANEMRRDNPAIVRNDNLAWSFDTFHDRRNGVIFEVNPIGGRLDGEITNEERANIDWNPVWDVAAGLFEQGYVVEAAIPFKSLRYRPGREQTWGFQVRRRNRWKNELSYLAPIPAAWNERGHFRMSLSATVIGLEAPPGSRSIEIKPYAIADLTSDATAATPISNAPGADAGIDVKYGITQNLTADVTVNTDFAQVEADEQQINLTRFSLFFPEKREFFLENQGLFTFGGAGAGPFGAGDTPVLFYSRRIGLDAATGREIPIDAGGRMTGRVGRVQRRPAEHPDGGRAGGRRAGDELLGRAAQARRAAAQQRRRHLHPPVGVVARPGGQPRRTASTARSPSTTRSASTPTGRGRGRPIRACRRRPRRAPRPTTSATARSSTTRATATASSSSTWSWAPTSIPRWGSCAARPSSAATGCSASAPARGRWRPSAGSSGRAASTTSPTAAACWRRARRSASSASSSRTATG